MAFSDEQSPDYWLRNQHRAFDYGLLFFKNPIHSLAFLLVFSGIVLFLSAEQYDVTSISFQFHKD